MICKICKKELTGLKTKYCSRTCKVKALNPNCYRAQQARANKRKAEFIKLLGGKCKNCGYYKNTSAMHFHHENPKLKKFRLDARSLSNTKLKYLLEEIKKCSLLCANCHYEHHHPNLNQY